MKYQNILRALFILIFAGISSAVAQSTQLKETDLKNVVITMKQELSKGWGGGVHSAYTVTISGNGTVTFDGMDEGKAISKYEPPVKVLRTYRIPKKQFKELVNEFNKINFFSLASNYCCRDNGDGTFTVIKDGDLSTVITSMTVNGKTKTVTNENFAPEELIKLQRKIYEVSQVSRFVKLPPYWLSRFPNEQFPPRNRRMLSDAPQSPLSKVEYRKIQRSSPKEKRERYIDLNKRWGFITPCVSTKAEVEKLLGIPTTNDETYFLTYSLKKEKIRVLYSSERTDSKICNDKTRVDTVILFSVIPLKDTKLSELKIDLNKFKKQERYRGKEFFYRSLEEGIFIETEIVEFSDKKQIEMVTSIQFDKNFKALH